MAASAWKTSQESCHEFDLEIAYPALTIKFMDFSISPTSPPKIL